MTVVLQIITSKFFQSENIFMTLHRGTYYTNYQWVGKDVFETSVGRILPSTLRAGLGTLTYELLEKIEGLRASGVVISTSGEEIVEDFAVVLSFVFNILCTTDPDLCRKLTLPESQEVSRDNYSSRFLPRVFDTRVFGKPDDPEKLASFLEHLLGLPRSSYEATIRAIRQYVAATHDVGREPTLAYSLLVTSIEALSHSVDAPDATWADYDSRKREPIDAVLDEVPKEIAEELRAAILRSEHVAIGRRFREFLKSRIRPEFYRAEAQGSSDPVTQQDLDLLLRGAYAIRSNYVHRLQEIEGLAADPFGHSEVLYSDEKPTLTFAGLARIVRHVIFTFVRQSPTVERETHAWSSDLPGVMRVRMSPELWIPNPDDYSGLTATIWLEAFLTQLTDALMSPSSRISDLSRILDKIETIDIGGLEGTERRAVLTLYHLFIRHTGTQRPAYPALLQKLNRETQTLNIEGLTICLLAEQDFPWELQEVDILHATYFRTRWNKNSLRIGSILESVFSLRLAEMFRLQGVDEKARQLISFAVENVPGNRTLLTIEETHMSGPLSPIDPYSVLPTRNVDSML